MRKTIVLLVIDGWGIGTKDYSNPVYIAKPKNINYIRSHYLSGSLQSSGIAVGLPWGEEGNSEVGHLTIGAGKVMYQHYPKITIAVRNKSFYTNPALMNAALHAKKNNSSLHLVGLLTAGNVHSSLEHLEALIAIAREHQVPTLNLHLFSDGKDSPPKSVSELLTKVSRMIADIPNAQIASVSGRFYALDRDEHWDRTRKTYDALLGRATLVPDLKERIQTYYAKDLGDEYIEPTCIGSVARPIRDHDAVVFFDFREDSIRQIARSFAEPEFDKFPIERFSDLYVTTMTNYSDRLQVPVAFPSDVVENPLGKVLADAEKLQLRIAETEKYAHVTYFFNGYRELPFSNEYRVLITSRNVAGHDTVPEMMTKEIATRVIEAVAEGGFDFITANFANADMVAHTGNYDAALKAIQAIDEEVARIMDVCLEHNVTFAITSDHGNIEKMIDPLTGRPETKHDPNLVPFYLIGKEFERLKSEATIDQIEGEATGLLSDIAPTLLEIMGIAQPSEMNGESLLRDLR